MGGGHGGGHNGRVTTVRHILVLPDRDAAEEVAEELAERLGLPEEPLPLREALAGEDDAEDAQWLIVLEAGAGAGAAGGGSDAGAGAGGYDPALLAALAESREGWLETEDAAE